MSIDKDFTFKKKYTYGTTLYEPKVVKTHKAYANNGACEACGAIINKGDFVLTANETMPAIHGVKTIRSHRLCASCTAEYIKVKCAPAPYVPYAERQEKWVRDNSVTIGTRVLITRAFKGSEDDIDCHWKDCMDSTVGLQGTVTDIDAQSIEVRSDGGQWWYPYFVLEVIKEPTYAERQAQWVKANGVKEGTKVRVTRTFTEDEDGSCCCFAHNDLVGETGVVSNISAINLGINMDGGYFKAVPYFALEVSKEPTYRPFANAEEFKPYRDEWFRVKVGGGFERITFYDDDGVRGAKEPLISYAKLFEAGERENGEPCGVKES